MYARRLVWFALAVALLAPCSPAAAQLRMGLGLGPSMPVGDLDDQVKSGFLVQGSAGLSVPLLPVGVRADLIYQQLQDRAFDKFHQLGAVVNGTLSIPLILVHPYLIGGVGVYASRFGDTHTAAGQGHVHDDDTHTNVGFHGGVGVRLGMLGANGFVEARLLNLAGDGSDVQTLPLTFGFMF